MNSVPPRLRDYSLKIPAIFFVHFWWSSFRPVRKVLSFVNLISGSVKLFSQLNRSVSKKITHLTADTGTVFTVSTEKYGAVREVYWPNCESLFQYLKFRMFSL